jgi:proline iminopeptidase
MIEDVWLSPAERPPIEPYETGMLDVGDGNHIYWEMCGNAEGKPALIVHGGPGAGTSVRPRRVFDPQKYRIISFDQRGCGRSTPHASDPDTDMSVNTTQHLVADMERLRIRLGIERWMLQGGSWGSTLILAYSEQHPERVSEAIILGATTTRRSEVAWLYHGVGRFFPRQWQAFVSAVPEAVAPDNPSSGDIRPVLAAYAARMADPDPAVRAQAAAAWVAWEDAVISLEPNGKPGAYSARVDRDRDAFVRICATYFSNGAWLDEGALLRNAPQLAGIPAVIFHGQLDLGCPADVAYALHDAWPGSRLIVVDDSGHTGSDQMATRLREELDALANRR